MRKVIRKSLRQTVGENQNALDFMSKLAGGDGHVNKVLFEAVVKYKKVKNDNNRH